MINISAIKNIVHTAVIAQAIANHVLIEIKIVELSFNFFVLKNKNNSHIITINAIISICSANNVCPLEILNIDKYINTKVGIIHNENIFLYLKYITIHDKNINK